MIYLYQNVCSFLAGQMKAFAHLTNVLSVWEWKDPIYLVHCYEINHTNSFQHLKAKKEQGDARVVLLKCCFGGIAIFGDGHILYIPWQIFGNPLYPNSSFQFGGFFLM